MSEIVSDGKPGSQVWYWDVKVNGFERSQSLRHGTLVSGVLGERCAVEFNGVLTSKIVYADAFESKSAALRHLAKLILELDSESGAIYFPRTSF